MTTLIAAPAPAEPSAMKWSVPEYLKLAEAGFFDGRRVELIDGEILDMGAMTDTHFLGVLKAEAALRPILNGRVLLVQLPLSLPGSKPVPDLAVDGGVDCPDFAFNSGLRPRRQSLALRLGRRARRFAGPAARPASAGGR